VRKNNVIAFPVFKRNDDRIREWLSDIVARLALNRASAAAGH
jgi:hypothetical protein